LRSFAKDKSRVDRFEPQIKAILGEHLIATADFERDTKQATDLLVLRLEPVSIACRVRTWGYTANYGEEFTIRASRPSGARTELRKIYEGWCQYGFYGFADPDDREVVWWSLYDLDAFRDQLKAKPDKGLPFIQAHLQSNDDGSSRFAGFPWSEFNPDLRMAWRKPARTRCPDRDCWEGKVKGKWTGCPTCCGTGEVPL
jgi:hypothetical protein